MYGNLGELPPKRRLAEPQDESSDQGSAKDSCAPIVAFAGRSCGEAPAACAGYTSMGQTASIKHRSTPGPALGQGLVDALACV